MVAATACVAAAETATVVAASITGGAAAVPMAPRSAVVATVLAARLIAS